ncbi:NUMOD1 domain-containing DNA-binding protein [bacterium]|jgi:hypothetical protein|nr:NUMOD1 domain-containing DNA-binding protein [bacterium]
MGKFITTDYHNEKQEDSCKTGIYTIEFINKPNIYYVGSASKTKNKQKHNNGFNGRWREHLFLLFNNKHYNKKLQNNFNKYGKENILFKIIELCDIEYCQSLEQYWLNMLDSYSNGYNLTYVIEKPTVGRLVSEYEREKCSERMKGEKNHQFGKKRTNYEKSIISNYHSKKVLQYDFDGNFIKEWKSIIQISNDLNIDGGNISRCCNKKQLTCKNYFWFFEDNEYDINEYIKNILLRKKISLSKRNQRGSEKPVLQYDLHNNLLNEFKSIKDATEYINGSIGNISKCCNKKQSTHKGFIWKYK